MVDTKDGISGGKCHRRLQTSGLPLLNWRYLGVCRTKFVNTSFLYDRDITTIEPVYVNVCMYLFQYPDYFACPFSLDLGLNNLGLQETPGQKKSKLGTYIMYSFKDFSFIWPVHLSTSDVSISKHRNRILLINIIAPYI